MPVTPETLPRHELVGLTCRVVAAENPDLIGLDGRVVVETKKTLGLDGGTRVRTVPKAGTTFEFTLPDGQCAVVVGDRLVARPARRTEANKGKIWHSD